MLSVEDPSRRPSCAGATERVDSGLCGEVLSCPLIDVGVGGTLYELCLVLVDGWNWIEFLGGGETGMGYSDKFCGEEKISSQSHARLTNLNRELAFELLGMLASDHACCVCAFTSS